MPDIERLLAPKKYSKSLKRFLVNASLSLAAIFFTTTVKAAEKVAFNYPPFGEFYINVDDLEALAKDKTLTPELAYYTKRLSPEALKKLDKLLSVPLEFNSLAMYKFVNSSVGEEMLKNFGKAIKAEPNRNGFYPLRSAIVQSAFDPEGLTIINILRKFPLETIYLDLDTVLEFVDRGKEYLQDREIIDRTFFSQFTNNNAVKNLNHLPDLRRPGKTLWQKTTFPFYNLHRQARSQFDLYLPFQKQPAPVIIISHGLASDRRTFAYLGRHLVSYGFAVVIIEHIDTSLTTFDRILSGLERLPEATTLIDRPLDVKYALDKLTQISKINPQLKGKLNLQQIGAIGQSLGANTVLTLGGAQLNRNPLFTECQEDSYREIFLDLSSLAICTFNQLPPANYYLQDKRIKAVLAINSLGKIFGSSGMSQIKIPTMLISGVNDLITPPVPEQMLPFTWLKTRSKYLVLVRKGTHFSFLERGIGVLPVPDNLVGPDSRLGHPILKALSTAFFKTYLAQDTKYRSYLDENYIRSIDTKPFELSVIRSLTQTQLETIIDRQLPSQK
jgi:predicted dienelactone hydrolase